MKFLFMMLSIGLVLAACGNNEQSAPAATAEIVPDVPEVDHYYSLKDGYEYGYEQGISEEDAKRGQLVNNLLMFRYAGQRDGMHQVYMTSGQEVAVFECSNPCEFMKAISFWGDQPVKMERMRATPGSIGWSVMTDAINGKLDTYTTEQNGRRVNVWFHDKKGIQTFPVAKAQ